ncbi:hypothetical protein BH10ACT11_BH10ACT11_02510 [soil metagenome]
MIRWRTALSGNAKSATEVLFGGRDAEPSGDRLAAQLAFSAGVVLLCTVIWGLTGFNYFWPCWVILGFGSWLGVEFALLRAAHMPHGPERTLIMHRQLSVGIATTQIAIWLFSGLGYFWPAWSLLGLGVLYGLHLWFYNRDEQPERVRELAERIETLTRTRRGAVDVQADELRRIERDLHDGAQARLVALSMKLGRAEERLADQPEAAELVRSAKREASAAIAELRDLARGIAPPVLSDRGLGAAVEALGKRSSIRVTTTVDVGERPSSVIENAAYFVVSEALTNIAKHAPESPAVVALGRDRGRLTVMIGDDGPGGADASAGSGLDGMRRRVEALDGTLQIRSPAGDGTTIVAELPCGQ